MQNAERTEQAAGSGPPRHLIVAGGGTGGHLFPGIAVAQEFVSRSPQHRAVFVSRGNEFERRALANVDFPLQTIPVEGIKGRGLWAKIRSSLRLPVSVTKSIWILNRFRPDIVLSVGSYAAGPVGLAAHLTGRILVLHEQNLRPGVTNRMLARWARRVYVTFEESQAFFEPDRVRHTGNPVRSQILQVREAQLPVEEHRRLSVLIVGGSQGAHALNSAMIEATALLAGREDVRFTHQTGAVDAYRVREAYESFDLPCTVQAFFDDMERRYRDADLILCRAGASTVAEITAVGKAALFVPFPFAADNHQVLNARALVERGAAEMIEQKDLSGAALAERISHYAANRSILAEMAAKARGLGRPHAAREIVDDMLGLLDTGPRRI